jgi:hypothetical protein
MSEAEERGHSESDPRRSGEELIDESGRNPTQRAIDEESATDRPVDAPWGGEPLEDDPARGEVGP